MIWAPPPFDSSLYAHSHGYEYPSYDAPRYPDMRPRIQLPPVYDFRDERYMHDFAPQPPQSPPSNQIGMTLNSVPAFARMGAYNGQ